MSERASSHDGRSHDHATGTGRSRCPRHESPTSDDQAACSVHLTRRGAIAGGLGVAVGLAGCLGDGGDGGPAPDPITLTQADQCDVCGMVVPNHPGPAAEIFYADQQPSGHDNPARFCSAWEAFQYDFERQDRGWERQAFYVTDYSAVDYEIFEDAGDLLVTSHVEAEAFVEAANVTFVAGSEVLGAMGEDLIAFSDDGDAAAFQDEYGGDLVGFEDVTPSVISGLGRS